MARLTRKNIKVFAGDASNNGVFGSLQANNPVLTNDVEQLQSLSAWGEGWNAATETSEDLPPLEEIQGVEYVTTYQQAYIMQEGIPEWAATVTYYKGCLTKEVTSTGFRIYNSLSDDNTGNLLSDTSNWKKVMDSDDLYAFDNAVVHKANAETITGEKTFSVSPIVPTATSGDSSTKAASTAFVTTVSSNLQTQINQKANSSDVVNLTGTQTISGAKTFTGATILPAGTIISKQDNNIEGGEIVFKRANNDPLAQDPSIDLNNGLMRFLYCNGVIVPASDALTTAVSTTGISKASNGFVKFGNGIIIQWGRYRVNNSALTTITFPIPFSGDSTYSVSTDIYGPDDSRERPFTVRAKTSSNITVYNYFGGGTNDCFIIAIGY